MVYNEHINKLAQVKGVCGEWADGTNVMKKIRRERFFCVILYSWLYSFYGYFLEIIHAMSTAQKIETMAGRCIMVAHGTDEVTQEE